MERLIERAFQLAASGEADSIYEIRKRLHSEGHTHFDARVLDGRALQRQLRTLIRTAAARPKEGESACADICTNL